MNHCALKGQCNDISRHIADLVMNQDSLCPSFLSFFLFLFEIHGYVNDAVEKKSQHCRKAGVVSLVINEGAAT